MNVTSHIFRSLVGFSDFPVEYPDAKLVYLTRRKKYTPLSKLLMNPKELLEIAIKDATCLLIPDAAKKVFTGQGYMNARLEDIIAAAGFAKPSFYSYYPDYEATFNILAIRGMNARALMTGEADDINLKIRGGC